MRSGIAAALCVFLTCSPALARTWTSQSGRQAEAEFVSLEGDLVHLRLANGEPRRCRLDALSSADRWFVTMAAVCQVLGDLPAGQPVDSTTAPSAAKQTLTAAQTAAPPPAPCQCTILVPEMVTEMRKVTVCEWRTEQRTANYTVCRMVPETREQTYEYTVPTYETRSQEFVYSVFKPVVSTEEREYTALVPHTEKRQGTRRVCELVPVEMTRTVCEDHGSWQQIVRHFGCGCCRSCTQTCTVWVPKLERREVKYTAMKPQQRSVPVEYEVTVCKPEKRTEKVQVCNYVAEQRKQSVPYTVCVPVTKTGTREVTIYRRVEEPRTHTYTVRVPHYVEKEVPVQVCRMVPKQVAMPAPSCAPARQRCGGCCW